MGKNGPFPGAKGKTVRKIIERHCGSPVTNPRGRKSGKGSHLKFKNPRTGRMIIFSYRDGDDIHSGIVRKFLMQDLQLTEEEARKELKK